MRGAEHGQCLLYHDGASVNFLRVPGAVLALLPCVGGQGRCLGVCGRGELIGHPLGVVVGRAGGGAVAVAGGGGFGVCGKHRVVRYALCVCICIWAHRK